MKLLFENWRKFISSEAVGPFGATADPQQTKVAKPNVPEHESDEYDAPYEYDDSPDKTKEKYFGKNPDNLECIRSHRKQGFDPGNISSWDFAAKYYECMKNNGFKELGAGSFRATFEVPGSPDLILKTVVPNNLKKREKATSQEMNKKEATGAYQTTSELVPKVYNSAKDYFWIISEKVTPIKTWEHMQEFFPVWKEESEEDFTWWFQQLTNPKIKEDVAIRELDKRLSYVKSGRELVNDPLIIQIRDLLAQWDLPSWDIRPHNVGYTMRDGKKQFVVLDPGFELEAARRHDPEPSVLDDLYQALKHPDVITVPEKTRKAKALTEKLELKPGHDGWDKYKELVAKAYKEAPMFDESAVASFEALEPFVHKMFDRIVGFGIHIDFVDDNPYESSEEMCRDVSENKILRIWKGGTDHQIFDAKTNLKLRAVHDYMAHCQGGTSFDLQGEIASYNRHMKTVPPSAAGALFTEVVGQAAFFLEYEYFPPQKIAILEGFDFFNVGEVDPEITGYRLDRDEKKLVSVEAPPEEEIKETYQKKVGVGHRRMKIKLIGKGKNTYNIGGKMKKPPGAYKRSVSAPAGSGGS